MGVKLMVYVGPYLSCEPRYKDGTEAYRFCNNKECLLYHQEKKTPYCCSCGSALHPDYRNVKKLDSKDLYDIHLDALSEIDGRNAGIEQYFLAPNLNNEHHPCGLWISEACNHFDLENGMTPKAAIAWFRKKYALVIKAIELEYDNVQVGYGVHAFYS